MRKLAAALLILIPLLAPGVVAQAPTEIEGNVIWDTPHEVNGDLKLAPNATLTIRGTTLTMSLGSIVVPPTAALVFLSTEVAPARLQVLGYSVKALIHGNVSFIGTPEQPVEVNGLGGQAGITLGSQQDAFSFREGFSVVGGNFSAEHTRFIDYAGGIMVSALGSAVVRDAEFASPYGVGLLVSNAGADIQRATFSGYGANLIVSAPVGPVQLFDLSFHDGGAGLHVRDATAQVRNVTVADSARCVSFIGGAKLQVDASAIECSDFDSVGIRISAQPGVSRGEGNVTLSDALIRTSGPNATAAIDIDAARLVLKNIDIGPLNSGAIGVHATRVVPLVEGLRFDKVAGWPVMLVNPPADHKISKLGEGEPGREGWLVVYREASLGARDKEGRIREDVRLIVQHENNGTRAGVFSAARSAPPIFLESSRIDAEERLVSASYIVNAITTDGSLKGRITGYEPARLYVYITVDEVVWTSWFTPLRLVAIGALVLTGALWVAGRVKRTRT